MKNSSLRRPEVHAFLKYYLDNVATLAEKGGYVAPHADDKAANQKALPAPPSATATTAKSAPRLGRARRRRARPPGSPHAEGSGRR